MNKKIYVMVLSFVLLCSSIFVFLYYTDSAEATWTNWDGPPNPNIYGNDFFTVVVIPDTQDFAGSSSYASIYTNMTQWIVDHETDWNIQFVSHVGDIVDTWNSGTEWGRVNTSMMKIYDSGIPYGWCAGNHDLNHASSWIPTIMGNYKAFAGDLSSREWWGNDTSTLSGINTVASNYQLLTIAGMKFMFMHVQFGDQQVVRDWAESAIENHSDYRCFFTTHSWIYEDGTRVSWEQIYNDVLATILKPNPNVFLLSCGHVASCEGSPPTLTAEFTKTRGVDGWSGTGNHTWIVRNWQGGVYPNVPHGGDGWLSLYTFYPSLDKIHVQTYSPYLGMNNTHWSGPGGSYSGDDNGYPQGEYSFWIDYDMEEDNDTSQIVSFNTGSNGSFFHTGTPSIEWTLEANAVAYRLQASTNPDFTNIVIDIKDINEYKYPSHYSSNSTHATFILPSEYRISNPNSYYWKLIAYK